MHSAYSADLERKRFARTLQRVLTNTIVFGTTLGVLALIGWLGIGASFEQVSLALPDAPKVLR